MAAEIKTPVCEVTGLPLPIAPNEPPKTEARFNFSDYHHHFHPRNDELLQGINGKAVRYSRGQFLPRVLHNRYHQIFNGPELPDNDTDRYRLSVLACAGVVPRQAINLSKPGEYQIVNLSNEEYASLASPDSIYIERARKRSEYYTRKTIGKFFASYALQQNVRDAVSEKVVGQFLDEKTTPERKKELGNFILREALGMTIDDIAPLDQQIRTERLVFGERAKPLLTVVRKFFTIEFFPDYHDTVAETLRRNSEAA